MISRRKSPKESMIIERVVTVEYLEPSMSRELLTKFPDKMAFDFDYSQSGIWSPLIPRGQNSLICASSIEVRRKLTDGFGEEKHYQENLKKVTTKIKKKMSMSTTTTKKNKVLDFSAPPVKVPKKGWAKVLKATTKQFKKKKEPFLHIKLANFLRNGEL